MNKTKSIISTTVIVIIFVILIGVFATSISIVNYGKKYGKGNKGYERRTANCV